MEPLIRYIGTRNTNIITLRRLDTEENEDKITYTYYKIFHDSGIGVVVQCVNFLSSGMSNITRIQIENWNIREYWLMENVAPNHTPSVVTGDPVIWNIPHFKITWDSLHPDGVGILCIELRSDSESFERTTEGMVSLRF